MQVSDEMVKVAAEAAFYATPRNRKFENLSAFQREKLLTEIRAALTAALSLSGWRTIDSAPKDGTWIIALRPECDLGRWDRVLTVQWSDEYKAFIWADHFDVFKDDMEEKDDEGFFVFDPYRSNDFTHWQPLPAPPATAGKENDNA